LRSTKVAASVVSAWANPISVMSVFGTNSFAMVFPMGEMAREVSCSMILLNSKVERVFGFIKYLANDKIRLWYHGTVGMGRQDKI
jgi:hypothetical protein